MGAIGLIAEAMRGNVLAIFLLILMLSPLIFPIAMLLTQKED